MLDIGITHANWSWHTIFLDDQAMQLRLVALQSFNVFVINNPMFFNLDMLLNKIDISVSFQYNTCLVDIRKILSYTYFKTFHI